MYMYRDCFMCGCVWARDVVICNCIYRDSTTARPTRVHPRVPFPFLTLTPHVSTTHNPLKPTYRFISPKRRPWPRTSTPTSSSRPGGTPRWRRGHGGRGTCIWLYIDMYMYINMYIYTHDKKSVGVVVCEFESVGFMSHIVDKTAGCVCARMRACIPHPHSPLNPPHPPHPSTPTASSSPVKSTRASLP